MSIKNVKPNRKSPFVQGYFKPLNEQKYIGPYPIIFRSSWERKFANYCDNNSNIIKWSSEPFTIKYYNILDKKYHKYYPDFYVKIIKNNKIHEYVVEVKPQSQLKKPIPPKRRTPKAILNYNKALRTFITNSCKIGALKKFAKQRGYEVLLVTEKSYMI